MIDLLSYDFFTNALIAAFFVSISCGVIGTYIVSRRMVFIAGGITHASFGGIGLAYFLGLNPFLGAAVFAIVSAIGVDIADRKRKVQQDSLIAIAWSVGMSIGILFIAMSPGYAPNLMSFLFGSILTVTTSDLIFMGLICAVIILVFALWGNIIVATAFDEQFAKTRGVPIVRIGLLMMFLIALTIVMTIKISGIILVLSLLTIPQATAQYFTNNFWNISTISSGISFIGCVVGLLCSYQFNLPSGATIIITLGIFYLIAMMIYQLIVKKTVDV